MRERILKPYRIIPQELYVLRDADRQLRSILDDMASPGYVLVSRQMGKTNLLLNARTTCKNEHDIFVYFDLSNAFNNEYECFRSVIDKALETNLDILGHLHNDIIINREKNYPAHIEHLQELRMILKTISGKLVIIYDEIDALTRASFSDKIFSQIRSIYFDRSSYTELNRLTYILSGVVEPTEIIKDPKISPFNIGEKIFLDDFSMSEHQSFLSKAKMDLDDNVSRKIYHWTSGNPRMTYDICAQIEQRLMVNESISANNVDEIVKDLYLTTYDKPPIDHIRELVENDKEIRDALTVIRYGKGSSLDDGIKVKLYLSGIVNSDFTSENIKIKNQVINESLNEKWLKNIEKKRKNIDELIAERVSNKEFLAIRDIYDQYNSLTDGKLSNTSIYNIGLSFYKTAVFDKAVELFSQVNYDRIYEKSYYLDSQFLLAGSYAYTSEYDKAINLFKEIIHYDDGGKYYYNSKLSLAKTLTDLDLEKHSSEAINLYEEILNNIKKVEHELDEGQGLNITISAHLYYGMLLGSMKRIEEAKEQYEKGLLVAKPLHTPQILLEIYKIESDLGKKQEIIEKILRIVTEEHLIPNLDSDTYPYFSMTLLYGILREVFFSSSKLFAQFCDYILNETEKANGSYGDYLFQIGTTAVGANEITLAKAVFDYLIFKPKKRIDGEILHSCYQFAFNLSEDKSLFYKKHLPGYLQFLYSSKSYVVNFIDITILLPAIDSFNEQGEFESARTIVVFLNNTVDRTDNLKTAKYLIEFFEIKTLLSSQFTNIAIQRSKDLLLKLENLPESDILANPYLKAVFSDIKGTLIRILPPSYELTKPKSASQPFRKDSDRLSVKYFDGRIKSNVRYKKVKNDIERGICEIIGYSTS